MHTFSKYNNGLPTYADPLVVYHFETLNQDWMHTFKKYPAATRRSPTGFGPVLLGNNQRRVLSQRSDYGILTIPFWP